MWYIHAYCDFIWLYKVKQLKNEYIFVTLQVVIFIMNYDSDNSYSDCDSIDSSDTYSINTTDTIDPSELTLQVIDLNAYYYRIQKLHNFLQTCDEQYKPYNNGVLFEYICAIIVNARRFDDISTLVKEYYDMPFSDSDHYSAGVDLMDNVNNVLYQCKKYDNTPLLRKHLGTFFHTLLRLKEFKGVVLVSEHTNYKYVREIKGILSIKVITDNMFNNVLERALSYVCDIPESIVTLSSELYDYQAAIIKLMEQNDKYSFQLPCGSGKSHLIMKYAITHNERIAILVPNISIAIMYCERMNTSTPVNKFFTGQECVEENNVSIVVYNSSTKLQRDYDTIIVDEAHHYLTDAHNIQLCKSKKLYLFSATLDEDECRKLTDNNYYILSQIDCINSHRILDFNIYIHCIGDDRQSALLKILKKYCEYQHVIVYCSTIAETVMISKMLNEHDISATYVSSALKQTINQERIKAFSNSDYRVIVNCSIINEGIDIKGCETCIFYSRVESHVKIIQCIGRTQRISENKLHGNVVLLSNNPEEDLPIFLKNVNKQYTVNNKHYYSKYKVNVINDIDCNDFVNVDDTIYEYERYIYEDVYKTAYKLELCKEFFSIYRRLPKCNEKFKEWNIGKFITHLKEGVNSHLKQQVEEIFEQEITAVKKISDEYKLELCKEFYKAYQKLPTQKEEFKNFKIGNFITILKYSKNLQLKQQVEEIFHQKINVVKKTV